MRVTARAAAIVFAAALLALGLAASAGLFTAPQGAVLDNDSSVTVTLGSDADLGGGNPFNADGSITVGNTTVDGVNGSSVTLSDPGGPAVTLSSIDGNGSELTADTSGVQKVGAESGVSSVTYRDVDPSDGSTEIETAGSGTVNVYGLSPDTRYLVTRTQSGDTYLQSDGSGVLAVQVSSGDDLSVQSNTAPSLSGASPAGNETITERDTELSVDVSDPDLSAGDEVTLEWYLDGQLQGTTTATSEGVHNFSLTLTGGHHEWTVVATDSEGASDTSGPHEFNVPEELVVRDELTLDLINGTNATISFYYGSEEDNVVTRNASDGRINMTGLPADTHFIATASADGYFDRRIFVPSLIEQQNIYLLNESADSVQPELELTDFTGYFDKEETVLIIEKHLNGTWEPVTGDMFGSANVIGTQLHFNQRHRMYVRNLESGRQRYLGAFTPTSSTIVDLEVHHDETIVADTPPPVIQVNPGVSVLESTTTASIAVDIAADENRLSEYTVEAIVPSGSVIHSFTGTSSSGELHEFDIDTTELEGEEVDVWVNWTADNGVGRERVFTYRVRQSFDNQHSLLAVLLDLGGPDAPNGLTSMLTLGAVLLAMGLGARSMGTEAAALAGIAVLAAAVMIGFARTGWLVTAVVAWLVLSGLKRRL